MAKIFKLSGYFVDPNGEFTDSELETILKNSCDIIAFHINVEEKDIGEWEDDNPLNRCDCPEKECEKYFRENTYKSKQKEKLVCENCYHYNACNYFLAKDNKYLENVEGFVCEHFKDKSIIVELP